MNEGKAPTVNLSLGIMNSVPRGTVDTKDLLVAKADQL